MSSLPPLPSLYDLGNLSTGNLEIIIASRPEEIEASQHLRYQVFFEEMGAPPTPEMIRTKRDIDAFDAVCDHLLAIERRPDGSTRVVGTYRLLRSDAMRKIGRFYSEGEYDINPIRKFQGEIMEVGRSCVDPEFRNRAVMQLLWRGIGAYVSHFDIAMMFTAPILRITPWRFPIYTITTSLPNRSAPSRSKTAITK